MTDENSATEDELRKFEEKYEKILLDDPSSVTFIFLAQVLYKQGKVDKAINVLIKGLRYNKKSVTGRFLLGRIYYDRWMIEQAKKEFQTVVKLAPDNLAACRMLVQIYKSEENYSKALELIKSAHAYHPQDSGIPAEIKELEDEFYAKEKREGEFAAAKEEIRSSVEAKSVEELASRITKYDKQLLSDTISDIYLDQGLYEKACSVLESILDSDPENDEIRIKLEKIRLYLLNKTAGFYTGE
ncbi:MAG: tetratricopeptide repeat protein [Deltaproteobacteria bacterium]